MQTIFSTSDIHPRDRFDYWHDIACRHIAMRDSQPAHRPTFQAAIEVGALGDLYLIRGENSAMKVARTARHIANATGDELFICRQVSGQLMIEQNGREVVLQAGDVTLLDPLLPYVGKFCSCSNLLVLKVPRRALEARVGKTWEMLVRVIKPTEAEGGLTSAFLAALPAYTDRMGAAAKEVVAEQVLDLIALSLTNVVGADRPKLSSAHAVALMKVRAVIDARLTDPALNPAAVAAAAGISVRYANSVLAREGTSITRLIQARRLARCRRALQDPLQAHRTLSEIAYSWGFSDMTHFGRSFKATYGVLPSAYRHSQV